MLLKPMLAKDVDWNRLRFPVAVQPKIDGIRVHVQSGIALTRTLKCVPNAEIRAALGRPEFEGLDGEIIVGSPTAANVYRRTSSFVTSESKTGEPWTFVVFDIIDMRAVPYTMRREALTLRAPAWPVSMALVAERRVGTVEALEDVEEILVEQGYEGAILRTLDSPYKHGRSTPSGPLLKVKRFIDFEAEVVGVYEEQHNANAAYTNELGRTARSTAKDGKVGKGTLGGLIVQALNGPAKGVEFRVGTGFDAAQREALWAESEAVSGLPAAPRNGLNGQVAKIKSFPIGVKDKPRHPVFLGWRDMEVDC